MNLLAPGDRELLLDALCPEQGFVLDRAVGTSFSVDLGSLLLAPLAFAIFEVDRRKPDPIGLLAAVRRHSENIALYCDAAHVRAPTTNRKLFVLLEETLLPVTAPRGGAFHPKLWIIRYTDRAGAQVHRILVLSRNLTFDGSWDLLVRLDESADGEPVGRDAANILRDLSTLRPSDIADDLAESVRRVRFEVPKPFTSMKLWALGFRAGKSRDPMQRPANARDALVVSPFLRASRLAEIAGRASRRRWVVSRAEEFERLGADRLSDWKSPLVLRGEAAAAVEDDGEARGLHAKLVVLDDGREARWYLGSANATPSAITRNAEVVLELGSSAVASRVASLMKDSEQRATFRGLFAELPQLPREPAAETAAEREEKRLDNLARQIVREGAVTKVIPKGAGYVLQVQLGSRPVLASGDRIEARAATRKLLKGVHLDRSPHVSLPVGNASEVTNLIVLRIKSSMRGVPAREFVLFSALENAPDDRHGRLLLDLIQDSSRFAQFVFLLLAADDSDFAVQDKARSVFASAGGSTADHGGGGLPLFESLVRASADGGERLKAVDRVIEDFASTDEGKSRIPEDFREMWEAFKPLTQKAKSR